MGLKEQVMELIRAADGEGLERLARREPRVARHLLGRLWDGDPCHRRTAARALGAVARCHPGLATDLVRRLVWGLNDESATNGVYGIAALAEIGVAAPAVMAPFVGPLASLCWDPGLRPEILRALWRMGEAGGPPLDPARPHLERHLGIFDPEERRLAGALLLTMSGETDEE